MKPYKDFKNNLLKNSDTRRAYDSLGLEYDFIRMIIRRRTEKGLTQAELARKVGTKQSAVSRLESGRSNPTISFLRDVARALDKKLTIRL